MLVEWQKQNIQHWRLSCARGVIQELLKDTNPNIRKISSFLNENLSDFSSDDRDHLFNACTSTIGTTREPSTLLALHKLAYIAKRDAGTSWNRLTRAFIAFMKHEAGKAPLPASAPEQNNTQVPQKIRQCRPDKAKFTSDIIKNVGFFNKNPNYYYSCYDGESAKTFIGSHFGSGVETLYSTLTLPQAQSDFFLLASLLIEGGISADVCSVNKSPISPLIERGKTLGLIISDRGLEKKFLFATPQHKFIRYYLQRALDYLDFCKIEKVSFDYANFTERDAFERCFMDALCEPDDIFDLSSVALIDDIVYNAFVHGGIEEENLPHEDDHLPFRRARLIGMADRPNQSFSVASKHAGARIIGTLPSHFFPSADTLTVIGPDPMPTFAHQVRTPFSAPALHLFQINDVMLSGHACLWKDGTFLQMESYLSFVAENETTLGHWPGPHNHALTQTIEEPVIVAFGAGHGCYGHYLVDDLPRLALARTILGETAFNRRKIVVPKQTPPWALNLLTQILQIDANQFIFFDFNTDFWLLKDAVVPSFPSRHYQFHPHLKEFYQSLSSPDIRPYRRLCLSRKAWEPGKTTLQRIFVEQDLYESMARERGFEVVAPETMSIADQIAMFSETRCQIGEHGSAQHASVYNRYGMTIGTINPMTEVQTNLGRLYGDANIAIHADSKTIDEQGNTFFNLTPKRLEEFFDAVDAADKHRDPIYEA